MRARAQKLYENEACANGQAGLGTYFMDLIHNKLRNGGRFGIILPMTATTGHTWANFRKLLTRHYDNIVVVTISGRIKDTYSAETAMKEVIITAKKNANKSGPKRGLFVSLDRTPTNALEATLMGDIIRSSSVNTLESGQDILHGSTSLCVGNSVVGHMLDCPLNESWPASGCENMTLLQIAHNLTEGKILLPDHDIFPIDVIRLYSDQRQRSKRNVESHIPEADKNDATGLANGIGPSHLQILAPKSDSKNRITSYSGPFNQVDLHKGALYPALWNNNKNTQRSMMLEQDCALEPKPSATDFEIRTITKTATHVHTNTDFGTMSQKLAMSYTKKKTIGGTAWPSIIIEPKYEKGLVLWCNSTLGLLLFWYGANHQHSGRSRRSRTTIKDMHVLNLKKLTKKQLNMLDEAFDEMCMMELKPAAKLNRDDARKKIDDAILNILNIDVNLDYLREAMSKESTFAG